MKIFHIILAVLQACEVEKRGSIIDIYIRQLIDKPELFPSYLYLGNSGNDRYIPVDKIKARPYFYHYAIDYDSYRRPSMTILFSASALFFSGVSPWDGTVEIDIDSPSNLR